MNIRNVLKTYSLLRTLSDDETALLNTLRGMNESERELLVTSLSPTPQKKTTKKSNKGGSKSPRASSLQAQIQGRGKGKADGDDQFAGHRCAANLPVGGEPCTWFASDVIHSDTTYANYHPFVTPSSAPRAAGKSSSANGSQIESNPSSETEKEDVSVAAGG